MISPKLKRAIGSVTASALILGGASLALAAPANAEQSPVRVSTIAADESKYEGWHEGTANGSTAFSLGWAGLSFGINDHDSQILNGLVESGQPGLKTSGTDLIDLIVKSKINVISGAAFQQVAITFGTSGWATLRPADPVTPQNDTDTIDPDTAMWTSSKDIGVLVANEPVSLSDIGVELDVLDTVAYSGYGMFANKSAPALVTSMTWQGTENIFLPQNTSVPESQVTDVAADEIRANEDTYTGWHEGYSNSSPAFSIVETGLSLGNGANSQIINGLATPATTPDLASLLLSADVATVSGTSFFQVPLTFGSGASFTTLRQDSSSADLFSQNSTWVSSKAIPATTNTAAIAANASVSFGTMVDALEAQGNVAVLGFGVLADSTAPAVVSSILWNGVRYNFVPEAITPPIEPTTPPVEPTTPPVEPTTPPVTPATTPTISSGTPSTTTPTAPGETFTVTVAGFTPNTDVEIYLHSTPVLLGTFRSNAAGVVTATVTIPANAPAGSHTIVFVDTKTGLSVSSAPFTVSAANDASAITPVLASTGVDALLPGLLAAMLVLAGLGIVASRFVAGRRSATL